MSSFEKNLSEGNVAKQLVLFSLPFLASNIIQSLYSVADMLIVGRFSGTTSMSGVNLGSQVTLILIVALVPIVFSGLFGADVSFGGTSLIIIVGVIIETIRQIDSKVEQRHLTGIFSK